MHCLRILLLGAPRIALNNEPHTLNRRKCLALLAYLAIEPGPHSRDALAALLWPGYDQTSARSNLRRTISLLNADLGQGWLDVERESVALPPRGRSAPTPRSFDALPRQGQAPARLPAGPYAASGRSQAP